MYRFSNNVFSIVFYSSYSARILVYMGYICGTGIKPYVGDLLKNRRFYTHIHITNSGVHRGSKTPVNRKKHLMYRSRLLGQIRKGS